MFHFQITQIVIKLQHRKQKSFSMSYQLYEYHKNQTEKITKKSKSNKKPLITTG